MKSQKRAGNVWDTQKHGLKSAAYYSVDIRVTRFRHMWRGKYWDSIMETFEGLGKAGADSLPINLSAAKTYTMTPLYDIKSRIRSRGIRREGYG